MASTNKTTNYDLSQYVGTDKPTYLSDYNGDMYKIDAQMKTNADNIATAISSISSATTTANTALSTAQSAETTANSASSTASSASTTAGNAQSTANSALSTATSAQTSANQVATDLTAFENYFVFTDFEDIEVADITANNCTIAYSRLKVATNSDGSLGKIYGQMGFVGGSGSTPPTFSFNSNLRPTTNINISNVGSVIVDPNGQVKPDFCDLSITTAGVVTVSSEYSGTFSYSGKDFRIGIYPCVLFMSDFGD